MKQYKLKQDHVNRAGRAHMAGRANAARVASSSTCRDSESWRPLTNVTPPSTTAIQIITTKHAPTVSRLLLTHYSLMKMISTQVNHVKGLTMVLRHKKAYDCNVTVSLDGQIVMNESNSFTKFLCTIGTWVLSVRISRQKLNICIVDSTWISRSSAEPNSNSWYLTQSFSSTILFVFQVTTRTISRIPSKEGFRNPL